MPRLNNRIPKFSIHSVHGNAFVRLNGKQIQLGQGDSPESRREYDRVISLWLEHGRQLPADWKTRPSNAPPPKTKSEWKQGDVLVPFDNSYKSLPEIQLHTVMAHYVAWAKHYYSKPDPVTGKRMQTRTYHKILHLCRILCKLYGQLPVSQLSPEHLIGLQVHFVRNFGWGRKHTNDQIDRIVAMLKFGTQRCGVPLSVWQTLQTVASLHKGRPLFDFGGKAVKDEYGDIIIPRENKIPPPVADDVVEQTLQHCSPVVADMIRFQRATGARPGETCYLRPCDIDRSEDVWIYRPASSKTEHHEDVGDRVIAIGHRGQEILSRYLLRDENAFCFSPAESEERRRAARTAARKTPLSCGNKVGSNCKSEPKRKAGDYYLPDRYAKAINRAAKKAGVDHWAPNQLRKTHAFEIRDNEELGLDHAQAALGHQQRATTERFYARNAVSLKAKEAASKVG